MILGPAFPLRGGIAQLNESLSQELTRQGVENTIFSFYMQYPSILFPGKTQKETVDRKGPKGVKIQSTLSSINPLSWWLTARRISKINPDFIIVRFWLPFMGPALGTVCRLVTRKLNIPVIAILDNVIPHEKRIGDRLFTNYFLKQCTAFVAMSASVIEDLNTFDKQKPRKLLYHPIYDHFGDSVEKGFARKHLHLPEDSKVILFFGIIRKYKGLKLLLKAIAQLHDKDKLKLVVAGEFYEDRAKYTKLIEKLGIQNNVLVHAGFVDKHKVKYYFCAADLVAQPYLSATQSGVTQIAYHFGSPMLVTNVGGLPEMVPHKKVGYVCDVSADSIANAIDSFYQEDKGAEFAENIVEERKRFQWDVFAKEIIKITSLST